MVERAMIEHDKLPSQASKLSNADILEGVCIVLFMLAVGAVALTGFM